MLSTVFSGAVYGVDAYRVEIEVNAGRGDPQIIIVGLPDTAVRESKDRVYTALLNSGFSPCGEGSHRDGQTKFSPAGQAPRERREATRISGG